MDALDLLFRRLVLAAREADAIARPIEVGEVLDKFIPYRAARRDGQLETNDDYLHAVMRLLAGERGYVFADETIQDDLTAELEALSPDLALVRTYANTKVRIATAKAEGVLGGDTTIDLRPPTPATAMRTVRPSAATPVMPAAPTARVSTATPVMRQPVSAAPPSHAAMETPAPSVMTSSARPGCPYCAAPLPDGRPLKYCPSCGQNLLIRRCSGCSAEIESGWKFCVICGRSAS